MKDFCDVDRCAFEPSKVSELYDSLKYDLIHNRDFFESIFGSASHGRELLKELYFKSKNIFDFIAPKEYGIEVSRRTGTATTCTPGLTRACFAYGQDKEKLEIGVLSSVVLLRQLVADLETARSSPAPSTRFYFTKESKIISLLNIVLLCGLPTRVGKVDELDCKSFVDQHVNC